MMRMGKLMFVGGLAALVLVGGASDAMARKKKAAPPKPEVVHGTQDEARAMLEELMRPSTDLKAAALKLRPTAADYAAILVGDAATKAAADYDKAWNSNKITIERAADQTDLKLVGARIEDIAAGKAEGAEFPGSYKKVTALYKPGLTIYAWKFVRPGEKLGMAYDGLLWVNNHWVWLPKPWRVL